MIQKDLLLTDDEKVARGNRALSLISSVSYKEGMLELYDNLHAGLDCLKTDDTVTAMSLVAQLRAIKCLQSKLDSWVQESRRLGND